MRRLTVLPSVTKRFFKKLSVLPYMTGMMLNKLILLPYMTGSLLLKLVLPVTQVDGFTFTHQRLLHKFTVLHPFNKSAAEIDCTAFSDQKFTADVDCIILSAKKLIILPNDYCRNWLHYLESPKL